MMKNVLLMLLTTRLVFSIRNKGKIFLDETTLLDFILYLHLLDIHICFTSSLVIQQLLKKEWWNWVTGLTNEPFLNWTEYMQGTSMTYFGDRGICSVYHITYTGSMHSTNCSKTMYVHSSYYLLVVLILF